MNKNSTSVVSVVVVLAMFFAPVVHAQGEWHSGIGTGAFALNIEGTEGFNTFLGPVVLDVSLDTSDIKDLLESAVGIGGYAAKDKWVILYAFQKMELEGGFGGATVTGTPASALVNFTGSGAELAATYRFAVTDKNAWKAYLASPV